jgi:hypothetical protein
MGKITYDNKVTLVNQPDVANENKVTASDMNEIKTIVNGNDDNFSHISTYSTSETATDMTWIDGKPIYRRVVKVNTTTSVNSATNLFQASYIDNLTNCKYMVEAAGLIYIGNIPVNLYYKPLTHYFQESHSDSWWNSQPMTIIIEYTKTN